VYTANGGGGINTGAPRGVGAKRGGRGGTGAAACVGRGG
jgi:hypothetical protein